MCLTFIVRVCVGCAQSDGFRAVLSQQIGFGTQETEILQQPITTHRYSYDLKQSEINLRLYDLGHILQKYTSKCLTPLSVSPLSITGFV